MSEKLSGGRSAEQQETHHNLESEQPQHEIEKVDHQKEHEKAARDQIEKLQTAQAETKKHAHETAEHQSKAAEQNHPKSHQSPDIISQQLKKDKYQHSLSHIQRQLNPAERVLSKFMHNPNIETASELGSRTIARPSALLGGSFFAFITSTLFLYMAKHYGWSYNFGLFLVAFVTGFVLGITIEMVLRVVKQRQT